MSFQENLRYYRKKAGYKKAQDFAQALNIPYSTYVGYEIRNREPKYETLIKIADTLGVPMEDLLRERSGNNSDTIKISNKFNRRLNRIMISAANVMKQICRTKNQTENKCKGCPFGNVDKNYNFIRCQWEEKPKYWELNKKVKKTK